MSFDRFLFLHKPLKYSKILTSVRVSVVLVVLWIVSIIVAILPLVGLGHMVFEPFFLACAVDLSGSSIAYSAVIFITPILLLVVFSYILSGRISELFTS